MAAALSLGHVLVSGAPHGFVRSEPFLLDQEFLGARPGWASLCHLHPQALLMSSAGLRGGAGPEAWTKLTWAWVPEAPLTGWQIQWA